MHCRSLVDVTDAIVDGFGVGIPCKVCGEQSRLARREFRPSGGKEITQVMTAAAPVRDVPRHITPPPTQLPPINDTAEFPAVRSTVEFAPVKNTLEFAPVKSPFELGPLLPAPPASLSESPLDKARARVMALPLPVTDTQRELANGFLHLFSSWDNASQHKSLLKRAALDQELSVLGQRYRAVLDVDPGNAAAKAAQEELLSLAMVTMAQAKNLGTLDEKPRGVPIPLVAGGVVAALVSVALVLLKVFGAGAAK
jgi:hypothetical protein